MSLFDWIIPLIEKELVKLEPEIEQFLIQQAKNLGEELMAWIEGRLKNKSPQPLLKGDGEHE